MSLIGTLEMCYSGAKIFFKIVRKVFLLWRKVPHLQEASIWGKRIHVFKGLWAFRKPFNHLIPHQTFNKRLERGFALMLGFFCINEQIVKLDVSFLFPITSCVSADLYTQNILLFIVTHSDLTQSRIRYIPQISLWLRPSFPALLPAR